MGGSAVTVDVGSVRFVVDHIGLSPQCIKYTLGNGRCTSVGTVKSYTHGLEGTCGQGDQITDVAVTACRKVHRASDIFSGCKWDLFGLAINIILDLLLHICFQLVAVSVDDLDSIIIERVVAGRDHDAAVKAFGPYHVRYARCGGYMKQIYICSGCSQTCYQ